MKQPVRILSSCKVVGDPGAWELGKDRNLSKNKITSSSTLPMVENMFERLGESSHNHSLKDTNDKIA